MDRAGMSIVATEVAQNHGTLTGIAISADRGAANEHQQRGRDVRVCTLTERTQSFARD